jgi:hypothetical protein
MKLRCVGALVLVVWGATASAADIKEGDKLQTLSNLHPDGKRKEIQAMNYQLPDRIPVCADITVKKVSKKALVFDYSGVEYEFVMDKHTKGADISLQQAAQMYFGPNCEQAKMKTLSKVDQDGIVRGRAQVGMTREGVLFAMGRPPFHANPSIDVPEWMYWRNRFARLAVQFDDKGKVTNVR